VIFVTVGGQLPFDRLLRAMDAWAARHPEEKLLAQTGRGTFYPAHMERVDFLAPAAFQKACEEARVMVSHAGIGNMLLALRMGKPVVLMPRLAALGEHRNDHQSATVARLKGTPGVHVAMEENALDSTMDEALSAEGAPRLGPYASDELLDAVRAFIHR
jgi:UDP-N-acetylglucosamine transferase subunit ALG13